MAYGNRSKIRQENGNGSDEEVEEEHKDEMDGLRERGCADSLLLLE